MSAIDIDIEFDTAGYQMAGDSRIEPSAILHFGDCISGLARNVDDESIHLTVTSIPFEELFSYSSKPECVSNNGSTVDIRAGRFALNMRFVVSQLLRVTAPGCNVCVHIQQLLAYKNQHGFSGRRDFRGAMVDVFRAGGFEFVGDVAIPKDPQQMAQRLNLHCLQFKTGHSRSSTDWAPAPNDYVLIFQKPGEVAVPVRPLVYREFRCPLNRVEWKAKNGRWDDRAYLDYLRHWGRANNSVNPDGWICSDDWVKWASGIWPDILQTDVLDGWKSARESDEEKHVCLARGSLVLTRDGHKPIEDVAVGDLVLTHRGRWRPVVAKACNGIRSVIRTTAQGVADLRTTPDHMLWVRSCLGRGGKGWAAGSSSPCRHRHNAETATPEWMQAKDALGSYVNLPLPPIEESRLSVEDWWVIGRWLGDGHFDSRGRAHISCAHEETSELVGAMGVRAGHAAVRRTATQVAIKDRRGQHSTEFTAILKRCGRGASGKHLPIEALSLNPILAEALLAGYLSADGHYVAKYDRWTASSVSRPLLLGMAMVAQRARGVAVSVYAGRPAGECVIEGRTVQTRQDWIMIIPPRNISGMMLGDGAWKKVRSITDSGEAETWDIQVEEDQSFVAEGCVVHNCPLQLSVIWRLVQFYSNPISIQPDVTVLDPFMGIGSTAFVCVGGEAQDGRLTQGMERNVVGFELKESYHDQSLRNVEKGRRASANAAVTEKLLF